MSFIIRRGADMYCFFERRRIWIIQLLGISIFSINGMETVTIVTNDNKKFDIEKNILSFSDILSDVVNFVPDEDDTAKKEDNAIYLSEVPSDIFMILFPLLEIIATSDVKNMELTGDFSALNKDLKAHFYQDTANRNVRMVTRLLKASVYLDSTVLINFFIGLLSQLVLYNYNTECIDILLESLESLNLNKELSSLLSKQILRDFLGEDSIKSIANLHASIKKSLHGKNIFSSSFSPNRKSLACSFVEPRTGISMYDLKNGKLKGNIAKFNGTIIDSCFSKDGSKIASLSSIDDYGSQVRIFNLNTMKLVRSFRIPSYYIDLLSFVPGSDDLIGNIPNEGLLWYSQDNKIKKTLY